MNTKRWNFEPGQRRLYRREGLAQRRRRVLCLVQTLGMEAWFLLSLLAGFCHEVVVFVAYRTQTLE